MKRDANLRRQAAMIVNVAGLVGCIAWAGIAASMLEHGNGLGFLGAAFVSAYSFTLSQRARAVLRR
jgi:hypothetical protein